MKIAGLKSLVLAALTPNVDRIIANFERTRTRLLKRADVESARGHQMLEESKRLRTEAANAFAECERAERIAAKLGEFLGK